MMNLTPATGLAAAAPRTKQFQRVLVTGGAGYVGAVLVPELLAAGYAVTVLDLCIYGVDVLAAVSAHPNFRLVQGDLRDRAVVKQALQGCDSVIHLACISNDASFELDPALGRSINYTAFLPLVQEAKAAGVRRFIYASSSSVYGIKQEDQVTEELALEPLTDYSRYKAMCEDVLHAEREPGFVTLILRPATVCGYSPRLRLDLTVNILTNLAINRGEITVFGGTQQRPNIHIADMARAYLGALEWPDELIDGQVFNVGYENHRLSDIAEMVRATVGPQVTIKTTPTDDLRSYRVSSARIARALGFQAEHTIDQAIGDLATAFRAGKVPNPLDDVRYYNIKAMQARKLV